MTARTPLLIAACGVLLAGCSSASGTTVAKPAATTNGVAAAVRDYHACGLDVLTPAAEGDCLARLLGRLDRYSYGGKPAVLYRLVRSTGAEFKQCLDEVAPSDVSTCDGMPLYRALASLVTQLGTP